MRETLLWAPQDGRGHLPALQDCEFLGTDACHISGTPLARTGSAHCRHQ